MSHPWSNWSLRSTLLLVLLPGLLAVMGLDIVLSWRNALAAANAAFDRSLLGAIKAMDANLSTASGGLSVELPYRMLEFFELTANGQVFYRVASGDGLVEIGNAELSAPPQPLREGQPQFHDSSYFGTPIRVGSYVRRLGRPLSQGSHSDRVLIQVAETLESRQEFTHRLVLEALVRDLLLLAAASGLLVLAVSGALRPLQRLRAEVAQRHSDDLTPIDPRRVPKDVRALVDTINLHMQRTQQVLRQRRQFIDDASHQLRTPLTTLATQTAFALRETDPARREAALQAIKAQVDDAIRQTNQMLALARADAAELQTAPLDLLALAERVTRRLWPLARQQGIDLGLEPWGDTAPGAALAEAPESVRASASVAAAETVEPGVHASGHVALLEEALINLLHNALTHTPPGGQVTVQAGVQAGRALLCVADNGPGMSAADRARVGERFLRVTDSRAPQPTEAASSAHGSGLGLAIAYAIAQRHGGQLRLEDAHPGQVPTGLRAVLQWPV